MYMLLLEKNKYNIFLAINGQNYLASHKSGQQALASKWLDEFANSAPAYLTIDIS
jgi:hypothetical protein